MSAAGATDHGKDMVAAKTTCRDHEVAMVVGRSFSSRAMGLGLDKPLLLLGGDDQAAERLGLAMDLGWQPTLRPVIERATGEQARWLHFGALLMEGDAGAGRIHVARRLAHLAGLPHVLIDLEQEGGLEQLGRRYRGPDLVLPSTPVLAMAAARCANPIVSVTGVDMVGADVQRHLARMIHSDTAGRWVEESVGGIVDITQVNWMIQSDLPGSILPELNQLLRPVRLPRPSDDGFPLHAAEVLAEAAIDENVSALPGGIVARFLDMVHRGPGRRSTATLYQQACATVRADPE